MQKVGEVGQQYIANRLAGRFEVSPQVIEKRLRKETLWRE